MRSVRRTTQFKKDVKRAKKRGKDLRKLKAVIELLVRGKSLPDRCHDHELVGQFTGVRDCHLEPDWLLPYEANDEEVVLIRTGSHVDLFRK